MLVLPVSLLALLVSSRTAEAAGASHHLIKQRLAEEGDAQFHGAQKLLSELHNARLARLRAQQRRREADDIPPTTRAVLEELAAVQNHDEFPQGRHESIFSQGEHDDSMMLVQIPEVEGEHKEGGKKTKWGQQWRHGSGSSSRRRSSSKKDSSRSSHKKAVPDAQGEELSATSLPTLDGYHSKSGDSAQPPDDDTADRLGGSAASSAPEDGEATSSNVEDEDAVADQHTDEDSQEIEDAGQDVEDENEDAVDTEDAEKSIPVAEMSADAQGPVVDHHAAALEAVEGDKTSSDSSDSSRSSRSRSSSSSEISSRRNSGTDAVSTARPEGPASGTEAEGDRVSQKAGLHATEGGGQTEETEESRGAQLPTRSGHLDDPPDSASLVSQGGYFAFMTAFRKLQCPRLLTSMLLWGALTWLVSIYYYQQKPHPPRLDPEGVNVALHDRERLDKQRWRFGLLECFQSPTICLMSFFCCPLRWADNMRMAGISSYFAALGLLWTLAFFGIVTKGLGLALLLAAMVHNRMRLRRMFDIPSGTCINVFQDIFAYMACCCCAVAQEARQLEEAYLARHPAVRPGLAAAGIFTGAVAAPSRKKALLFQGGKGGSSKGFGGKGFSGRQDCTQLQCADNHAALAAEGHSAETGDGGTMATMTQDGSNTASPVEFLPADYPFWVVPRQVPLTAQGGKVSNGKGGVNADSSQG